MTPSKPPTPCSTPGCPNDTPDEYCQTCDDEREDRSRRSSDRPTTAERGYDGTWQKLSKKYRRKHPVCERCKRRGETTPSEEVHHIVPIGDDRQERLNPKNLEALCRSCHDRETRRERTFDRPTTILVCGPAGSGKTTYVHDQRSVGDLVVDVDHLWSALGFLPENLKPNKMTDAVLSTREFILDYIRRPSQLDRAWVIATAASPDKRQDLIRHVRANDVRILAVDPDVCKSRLRDDPTRRRNLSHHLALVDEWWSEYEPRSDVNEREIEFDLG